MTAKMLSCRELIEFLAAYLDDELSPDERGAFDAHLAVCPYCVDYLASYQKTRRLGKQACEPGGDLPEDVPAELIDAILASRSGRLP